MPVREIQHRKDSPLFAQLCSTLLRGGLSVQFRVHGESMRPNILDGDAVLVAPSTIRDLRQGDIALIENPDGLRVHRVDSCNLSSGDVITRSDSAVELDPSASRVFGKVIVLQRNSGEQSLTPFQTRFVHPLRAMLRRLRAAAILRHRRASLLLSGIVTLSLLCATFLVPVGQAQSTADLQLTQTANSPAVATNATLQSLGTATTVTWAGGVASFTFPTPLPSGVFTDAPLTTTGFTPAVYNVTNATITSVNAATGVVTIALAGQSLGTASAASWAANVASFTFPTPLPSYAVVGAQLTTTGFTPAAFNVTDATITSVNTGTGVIQVALPSQSMGSATTATWAANVASFTFPIPLPSEAVVGALLTTTGFTPAAYNVTNASITSVNAVTGVVTVALANQSMGTATAGTWAANVASFTFLTPLPSEAVVGAQLTTTGFTPAAYNLTNASIASVNTTTGVVTVALPNQSLGAATAAAHVAGHLSFTFTTPLPSEVVVGALLTTTGFAPAAYNVTNAAITSVAGGVIEVAIGANPGASTALGTGTVNPSAVTTDGTATVGPSAAATTDGTGSVNPSAVTTRGTGTVGPGSSTTNGTGTVPSAYSYSEVVTNNSSSASVTSATITVYMQTPADTIFEAYTGTNWTCTTPAVGGVGPIICTYGTTLNSGTTASTLYVDFEVAAGTAAGTTIQNSATVTNSTFVDTVPSNNTSITSTVVEPATTSDLAVSMSVSPTPVFVSSNLTYNIQVQNLGQAAVPATSAVLTDTLPTGVNYVSSTASAGWSCSYTAPSVSCSNASPMAPYTTASITITVTAPSTATTLTNTATTTLSGDPNSANNSATAYTVVQPISCATPGRDGPGGTLPGIVNAYYPPSATGTLASASTSVALGAAASGGAQKAIAAGDLLLIIQMQDASINDTNTSSYGHGVPGDPGAGSNNLGSSGLFEFVTATNAVPVTGGSLTFTGTGPTGGLLNAYFYNPATATQGLQTYQVIRVPQYTSATLGSCTPALPCALSWNGSVGGVFAIDVSSQLALGGAVVALDALGFRGAGGITLTGTTNTVSDTDYVTSSPANLPNLSGGGDAPANSGTDASKGEGIAGTPHWVAPALSSITPTSTALSTGQSVVEGLPNGSFARGGPGNAGGGGTDGDPKNNDYNSGGGAGGNGGTGGQGGYGWNSMAATNTTDGGFGGVAFPSSTSALVMGGGGGAGTTNNGTYYISSTSNGADCGTSCTGVFSSGGAGGGIVIIHAGSVAGTGTITSNGQSTLSTLNDSTGGAGAGGSILFFANTGGLSGLTVNAIGGNGGNAWQIEAPGATFPGQRHGPGGGGGGGVIFLSANPASSSVAGGSNGYTDTIQDSYGATPGQPGMVVTTDVITETPGTQSGAYCGSADLSVTNTGSPLVVAPGGTITYTQVVANNGPLDAVNAVFTESTPVNTTFNSITPPAGWTCPTQPAVGGTGPISCNTTSGDFPVNTSGVTFTVVVTVSAAAPSGSQIVDVANINSATKDPNPANNTATAITTVGATGTADLSVTNATSPLSATEISGNNVTLAALVSNLGPSASAFTQFQEAIPSGTTFQSLTAPSGWTCFLPAVGSSTGTVSCSISSAFASGATAPFSLVLNVTAAAGTVVSATATVGSSTPDPNSSNNSATATFTVANSGQADLAVTATASPNPVTQGNNVTFTETVTNNGPATETNATFTVTLPANTTLVSFTPPPSGWSCSGSTTFTCNLTGTLLAGSSANFPLVVQVNAGVAAGTVISATPSVTSTVSDPNLSNNSATASTIVALPTQSSVSITKSASPEPVDQNSTLTYTITVTNGGPAVATGTFTVTDVLPGEVTYIPNSYSTTSGSCTGTTTVTCTLNNLAVGSTTIININVTATTFSASSLSTNTATITTNSTVSNVGGTSLGTATNATWAAGVTSFTFPTPLPANVVVGSLLSTTGFTPGGYNVTNASIQSVNSTTGVITVTLTANPGASPATAMGTGVISYPLSASAISTIQAPTAVDISSFRAFSQPGGSVILEWHTNEESRNLGFHVYREDASGRTRIDPSLIAGSALRLRGGRPQHAAKTYRWIDRHPSRDAAYWVEDVDVNGTRTEHGPAYPESVATESSVSLASSQPSPLLSELHAPAVSLSTTSPMVSLQAPRPVLPVYPPGLTSPGLADHPAVKIAVDHEGWYRVSLSQLHAAGLAEGTDPRTLHLYAEGVEQPLLLTADTTSAPSLGPDIEFYGTGIDTPFSADRIYWLVSDNQSPKRILSGLSPASGSTAPDSFPFTVLREDRYTYFAALLNGDNNDNFFGAIITSDPTDQTLAVTHLDSTSPLPISVDLALQGATDGQEHSIAVQFNGATIGEMDFYGQILAQQSFPVEASLLQNGTNTVTLTALNGDNDVSVVQSIALHYAHTYAADSDWLRATASSGSQLNITAFTNPHIHVFDITDPSNISELSARVSLQSGAYSAALSLTTGGPAVRTILAFADDAIAAPVSLSPHVPAFLAQQRIGADVVIISHPDFVPSLAPLVSLRESQGHQVSLVTTDQIFDEFNYGERSPYAMRTFLQEAASVWQRKPQSILLVGDASLDPRNYLGYGYLDFVPTRMIETAAFKTASDDWFTDFTQNGFATIPTGRFTVQTTAEADLVVSKIIGYENGSFAGSWNSQSLLVADQNLDSNFTAAANSAAATLPPTLQTSEILADSLDTATAHSQILTALNNGELLVDYSGHGAQQQWSFSDLFDINDAAALSNGGRLPVYLLMDCLNGFFQDPSASSLADSLLLAPNGGAVAVWASSGFTEEAPQSSMNQAFLHAFASNPSLPIGRIILQAKAGTTDSDVRRTWILFGDPAMKFQFAPMTPSAQMSAPVQHPVTAPVSNRLCVPGSICSKEKLRQ